MASRLAASDGWTRVQFGDVVRLSTERCTDPAAAGIDRYVGLEHLEPRDLRIRSWGNVADGVTFTNRFRPGQLLFGKRRAYQRKVAVAEFDGICSSDIYVFEPADDRLLPDLLPFICQTDGFFEHALKTSAGSLSPRTNWTSLAHYEFDLPPLEKQRLVSQVIKKTTDCVEAARIAADKSHSLFLAALRDLLPPKNYVARMAPLGELYRVGTGGTPSRSSTEYWGGEIPWVKTGEVKYETIRDTEERITVAGLNNSAAKVYPSGSIVMALFGQGPTLGRVAKLGIDASTNQACAVIQSDDADALELLYYWLWRQYKGIRTLARGATQPNLNVAIVKSLLVPTASSDLIRRTLKSLRALEQGAVQTNAYLRRVENESRLLAGKLLASPKV